MKSFRAYFKKWGEYNPVRFNSSGINCWLVPYEYGVHQQDGVLMNPDTFRPFKLITPDWVSLKEFDTGTETRVENLRAVLSKEQYLEKVKQIKQYIKRGDLYEVNFCFEFIGNAVEFNPAKVFEKLVQNPGVYCGILETEEEFVLCNSPERYLKREGKELFSQPIKGTRPRGATQEEDTKLKKELYNSLKERNENVMIVDLVRNDLSRIAQKGSVEVKKLFEVKTFPTVHQLVSTIACRVKEDVTTRDVLYATFPMGSMTGVPKPRALQLMQQLELTPRGVYSGAIGIEWPNGNFDFCVLIRSIVYHKKNRTVSFHVGSAITDMCNSEEEYWECMVKADNMLKALTS